MSFYNKISGIMLIIVFCLTNSAFSVGYERYDLAENSGAKRKTIVQTVDYDQERSSFFKKCPAVLDEIAFFVRDLLSQFGLTQSGKP
ncbi:MAG TPA: hypothetical protein VK463_07975 [Desulfomonilaceae bacterium]|nr:hypothetical protein [Desulfomonilaceae bacterium]